jgi:hypothetical protein
MKTSVFITLLALLGLAYALHDKEAGRAIPAAKPAVLIPLQQLEPVREKGLTPDQVKRKTVTSMIHVLTDGHQIFAEAWKLLVGEQSGVPNSALKAVASRLSQHFGQNQEILSEVELCPNAHDVLDVKTDPASWGVSHKIKIEQYEISLQHNGCANPPLDKIATIRWSKEAGKAGGSSKMTLEVKPSALPEGVGASLAMLNATITCEFTIADNERILDLSCKNLGQGTQRAEHFAFSRFEYHADQHDLLIVDADRFKNLMEKTTCVSKEPCFQLHVPLEGKVKVVENRKMGKKEVAVAVAATAPQAMPMILPTQQNQIPPDLDPAQAAAVAEQMAAQGQNQRPPSQFDNLNPQADTGAQQGVPYQDRQKLIANQIANAQINQEQVNQEQVNQEQANQEQNQQQNETGEQQQVEPQLPGLPQLQAQVSPAVQGFPANEQLQPQGVQQQQPQQQFETGSGDPQLPAPSDAAENVQPRQPSGQQDSPVLLPQGQYSGMYNGGT